MVDLGHVATAAYFGLLIVALAFEAGLAALVIRRAGGQLGPRFLALDMLLHPLALAPAFVYSGLAALGYHLSAALGGNPNFTAFDVTELVFILSLAFIASADVAFALTYPRPAFGAQRRRWILPALFVPPALLVLTTMGVLLSNWTTKPDIGGPIDGWDSALGLLSFGLFGLGLIVSFALFWQRSRRAPTLLERQRARFMWRAIVVPLLATAAFAAVGLALAEGLAAAGLMSHTTANLVVQEAIVLPIVIAAYALIPPVAMGVGLLRLRIIDWDRRARRGVRRTISYALVTSLFVLVFFGVSETAQAVLRGRFDGALVGLVASAGLALALAPIERATARVARRLMPLKEDDPAFLRERRLRVYRATYEDLAADRHVSERERVALRRLATKLGLTQLETGDIEATVEVERATASAPAPTPTLKSDA